MERGFVEQGYAVDRTADGREGLFLATGQDYDAVVLDRMLPGLDGLSVLKAVRAAGVQTPVLILSAMGALDERVRGLRAGSDDYLVKPFAFVELHARIDALIRRSAAGTEAPPSRLVVADLELDLLSRKVTRAGRPIPLQQREFQMLEYLMRHAGRVVTRTMLLEGVWNYHFDPQTNVIDVHISRLRQKVDKDFDSPLIHTVRGSGYMLALDG
jgi:two-component system, OmpR family, response regulator